MTQPVRQVPLPPDTRALCSLPRIDYSGRVPSPRRTRRRTAAAEEWAAQDPRGRARAVQGRGADDVVRAWAEARLAVVRTGTSWAGPSAGATRTSSSSGRSHGPACRRSCSSSASRSCHAHPAPEPVMKRVGPRWRAHASRAQLLREVLGFPNFARGHGANPAPWQRLRPLPARTFTSIRTATTSSRCGPLPPLRPDLPRPSDARAGHRLSGALAGVALDRCAFPPRRADDPAA